MQQLLIFPYNGNAMEAADAAVGQMDVLGFVDDTPEKQGFAPCGLPVFDRSAFERFPDALVLAVPGSPQNFTRRKLVIDGLNLPPARMATVVHPKASIGRSVKLGYNVLIMAGVVITSNAIIGNHVCILPNSVIHHDCIVDDLTLIASGVSLAGNVHIQENCYLGTGSTFINHVSIGARSLVGMAANVVRSLPENSVVKGNPAR